MLSSQLFEYLKILFDANDISRGTTYFRRGHVISINRSKNGKRIEALVQGSDVEPYHVFFQFRDQDGTDVQFECDCPRFEDTGACKHAYAVLLALRERNWLPGQQDEEQTSGSGLGTMRDQLVQTLIDRGTLRSWPWDEAAPWRTPDWWRPQGVSTTGIADARYWFAVDLTCSENDGKTWAVAIWRQKRLSSGAWGTRQRVRSNYCGELEEDDNLPPEDIRVLKLVRDLGLPIRTGSYDSWYSSSPYPFAYTDRWLLPGMLEPETMAQLMDHPRWVVQAGMRNRWEDIPTLPLHWTGQLVQCQLACRRDANSGRWFLLPRFITPEGTVWEADGQLLVLPGNRYLVAGGKMYRIAPGPDRHWLEVVSAGEPLEVPEKEVPAFFQWASSLLPPEALELLPEPLRFPIRRQSPAPRLLLRREDEFPNDYKMEPQFQYGNLTVRYDEPQVLYDAETGEFLRRDPEKENQWLDQLQQVAIRYGRSVEAGYVVAPGKLPLVIRELPQWELVLEGKPVSRSSGVSFRVQSDIDWFDLEGEVYFGDQKVTLPKLLRALHRGQQVIKLPDGSQGIIDEQALEPYTRLLSLGQEQNGRIRFRSYQALLLDSLLNQRQEQATLQADGAFRQLLQRLQEAEEVREESEPVGFQGKLRRYQQQGLGWLKYLQRLGLGGCLADDMGLGKTVQVLALLLDRKRSLPEDQRRPHLIVVPKSLIFNWQEEAARFAPELSTCAYIGPQRKKLLDQLDQFDLVVTTYQTMLRDVELLVEQEFDYVVLDEATAIKNPDAQCAKAARVLPARHRLALTGTPVENHLLELWSLFEFLNPGILGTRQDFQRRFGSAEIDEEELKRLQRGLAPFLLRRTKQQVLRELPPKSEQVLYCDLSPREKRQYQELRDYYRKLLSDKIAQRGIQRSKIHILESLLRLRQAACHPGLLDAKQATKGSSKFDMLLEHLEELLQEGHKALVFSQFTSLLDLLRKELERRKLDYAYLHGRTRKRKEVVQRFQQDPDCRVFLISLKAGGHGLNLTAADYVFLLDPWWNPAVEAQAVDRAHRIGQDKPVMVYRLIARETVEEKVLQLQQQKRKLAEAIIRADGNLIRSLRPEDLELLLS